MRQLIERLENLNEGISAIDRSPMKNALKSVFSDIEDVDTIETFYIMGGDVKVLVLDQSEFLVIGERALLAQLKKQAESSGLDVASQGSDMLHISY